MATQTATLSGGPAQRLLLLLKEPHGCSQASRPLVHEKNTGPGFAAVVRDGKSCCSLPICQAKACASRRFTRCWVSRTIG